MNKNQARFEVLWGILIFIINAWYCWAAYVFFNEYCKLWLVVSALIVLVLALKSNFLIRLFGTIASIYIWKWDPVVSSFIFFVEYFITYLIVVPILIFIGIFFEKEKKSFSSLIHLKISDIFLYGLRLFSKKEYKNNLKKIYWFCLFIASFFFSWLSINSYNYSINDINKTLSKTVNKTNKKRLGAKKNFDISVQLKDGSFVVKPNFYDIPNSQQETKYVDPELNTDTEDGYIYLEDDAGKLRKVLREDASLLIYRGNYRPITGEQLFEFLRKKIKERKEELFYELGGLWTAIIFFLFLPKILKNLYYFIIKNRVSSQTEQNPPLSKS